MLIRYDLLWWQVALLGLFCLVIFIKAKPVIAAGVMCASMFWVENYYVLGMSIFWVLGAALIAATIRYCTIHAIDLPGLVSFRDRIQAVLLVGWFIWMAAQWATSDLDHWFFIKNYLGYSFLPAFALLICLKGRDDFIQFALSFIVITLVSGIASISQEIDSLANLLQNYTFLFRLFGINNQNGTYFAIPFAISILFLLHFISNQPTPKYPRIFNIIPLAFCLFVVLAANARQVEIALFVSIAFYGLLSAFTKSVNFRLLTTIIGLGLLGYELMLNTAIQLRWINLLDSGDISAGRFTIWADSWQVFLNSPVLGSGLQYFSGYFAHNLFLDILAGQGLVGLFFFGSTLVLMTYYCIDLLRTHETGTRDMGVIAICLFIFSLVQLQFTAGLVYGWHLFWFGSLIWRLHLNNSHQLPTETPNLVEKQLV